MMNFVFIVLTSMIAFSKDLRFSDRKLFVPIKWEMIDPINPNLGLKPTFLRFTKPVYRFDNITLFSLEAVSSKGSASDYREFKILPRKSQGRQTVEIQLQDRSLLTVEFSVSQEENLPLSYDFKPEKIPNSEENNEKVYTDMLVMKAVLLGKNLFGFDKKNTKISYNCESREVTAFLQSHLVGHEFSVIQVKVKNVGKTTFNFVPQKVSLKNRDYSKTELKHFESELLASKKEVTVTIVLDNKARPESLEICKLGLQLKRS